MRNGFPEWWKHGQKVRTRKDGILTLNIAPDAEYWLTNDEGKEVYVFSADILGPVKNDAEVCRPMSNIDKHPYHADGGDIGTGRIREIADNPYGDEEKCWLAKRVLALQAELEATYSRIGELEVIATDYGMKFQRAQDALKHQSLLHKTQIESAEKRIAELETREVILPQRMDPEGYHIDEAYMVAAEDGEYLDRDEVIEAMRTAGIRINGEG
ncbi:hypothetical protein RZQ26_06350 [Enterobacter roggenkampii]|uniref:hypothetical protein n=1 Tax=Enterobacter roggenkampii TaxID=1812935 RepID=UPI00292B348F|nr:hypothetical protein [Enterobacter roggenkampii]MDV1360805.1 hypothetical protein [Enterobacter roggenkampii]MDV1399094.1 hypothetical protein [Enterobacter roggenkampii]